MALGKSLHLSDLGQVILLLVCPSYLLWKMEYLACINTQKQMGWFFLILITFIITTDAITGLPKEILRKHSTKGGGKAGKKEGVSE